MKLWADYCLRVPSCTSLAGTMEEVPGALTSAAVRIEAPPSFTCLLSNLAFAWLCRTVNLNRPSLPPYLITDNSGPPFRAYTGSLTLATRINLRTLTTHSVTQARNEPLFSSFLARRLARETFFSYPATTTTTTTTTPYPLLGFYSSQTRRAINPYVTHGPRLNKRSATFSPSLPRRLTKRHSLVGGE